MFSFVNQQQSGAQPASGSVSITTDKLVYQPADEVSFAISLDSGPETATGDLVLSVYPAGPLSAPPPPGQEPLSESVIEADFSVSGQAAVTYQNSIEDLKAGTGGFMVKVALVSGGEELLSGIGWLAVVEPGARDPLDLVLLWSVGAPPERDPEQVFQSTRVLERCQNVPRSPDTIIQHPELAARYPRIKTTYAFEGALLDQLTDMADGFPLAGENGVRQLGADSPEAVTAASCLEGLRTLVKYENVEIVLSPYYFAGLPGLAREGWNDGNGQYRVGRDVLSEALLLPATPKGAYVPSLDLTTDSLRYVASTGGEYTVLDGNIRQSVTGSIQPGELLFRLRDLGGERLTAIFASNDASQALLGAAPSTSAFFAALASAYVSDAPRLLVAASPVATPPLSAAERDRVYAELQGSPWIESLTLAQAQEKYRPDTEPVTLQRFINPLEGYITLTYYERLVQVHERFEDYRVAVDTDEPELLRQVKNMYTAESEYFLRPGVSPEEANIGLAYLDHVEAFVEDELAGLSVAVGTPRLQMGPDGEARVTITNSNPYPFNVDLVVLAEDAEVPREPQRLRLETGSTEVAVPYRAEEWTSLSAQVQSRGHALAGDEAGVRPMTPAVWTVVIVTLLALLGGLAYYLLVMRKR